MERVFFLLFAGVALGAALNLLLRRNPLESALSLLVALGALTGLYILLGAYFIAIIQVIVYAGAIMVLFVFVIMLLNVRVEETRLDRRPYFKWLAIPFAVVLVGEIGYILKEFPATPSPSGAEVGVTASVGRELFTRYLLPFEVTSVLILIATIGAVILARRE
jgi:NADH-quinone oxidoreductase subunit J